MKEEKLAEHTVQEDEDVRDNYIEELCAVLQVSFELHDTDNHESGDENETRELVRDYGT